MPYPVSGAHIGAEGFAKLLKVAANHLLDRSASFLCAQQHIQQGTQPVLTGKLVDILGSDINFNLVKNGLIFALQFVLIK